MRKPLFYPSKYDVLAVYNAEVYRGLVHTETWTRRMMELQDEYDVWLADYYRQKDATRPRNKSK